MPTCRTGADQVSARALLNLPRAEHRDGRPDSPAGHSLWLGERPSEWYSVKSFLHPCIGGSAAPCRRRVRKPLQNRRTGANRGAIGLSAQTDVAERSHQRPWAAQGRSWVVEDPGYPLTRQALMARARGSVRSRRRWARNWTSAAVVQTAPNARAVSSHPTIQFQWVSCSMERRLELLAWLARRVPG